MKGLIHIHSNFSDGELSLEEIKEKAQKLGASFVLMADHMEWVGSQEKVAEIVEKCRQLSDDNFLMVPGFEVSPKGSYHVLIYNGKQFINHDPTFKELLETPFTEEQFLVLAHASHYSKKLPRELEEKLDGIEVWNARYDSRYAPNMAAFKHLKGNDLVALAGLDAHSSVGLKKMWIEMDLERLGEREIFKALRQKKFKVRNGKLVLDINKPFTLTQRIFFTSINYCYAPIRAPFAFFAKIGIEFPSFLRKIFHKFF